MIVCGSCGTDNPDGTEFCTGCGRFLEWTQSEPISRPPQPLPPEPGPTTLRDPVVTVDPPPGPVTPGDALVLAARVRNVSSIVDRFDLTMAGISAAWWKVTPTSIRLYPGTEAEIRLEFRPPRGPDLLAGEIPVALNARSGGDEVRMSAAEFRVEVSPVTDVNAEMVPRNSRALRTGRHEVRITNERATAAWRASARAVDPDAILRLRVDPETVEVAPGGKSVVSIAVQSPSIHWYGRPEGYSFNVELRPTDGAPPIRLDGHFEQRSLIRGIPLAVAGGLLAVTVVAVGVLAGWIPPKPTPSASPTDVAQASGSPSVSPQASATPENSSPSPSAEVTPSPTPTPTPTPTPAVADWAIAAATAIGGFGNPVGITVPTEQGGGQFQAFDSGVVYLRPDGGAVPMFGDILGTWRCRLEGLQGSGCPTQRTGPLQALGFPVDRERQEGGEPYQLFDKGGIYCKASCGSVVFDPVHALMLNLRSEGIDVGLPTRDVIPSNQLGGGWLGRFVNGFMFSDTSGNDWVACTYEGDLIRTSLPLTDCFGFATLVKSLP